MAGVPGTSAEVLPVHARDLSAFSSWSRSWPAPPPGQIVAHTNLYRAYQTAPGRTAGTVETRDVDFGGTS
jgi:hypothetical protein